MRIWGGLRRGPLAASLLTVLLAVQFLAPSLSVAAPVQVATFTATGSVEEVDVVGLAPFARASLLSSKGATVASQSADSLGGLVFHGVSPGTGYVVRLGSGGAASGPLTVYSSASAPWDPGTYGQSISDSGYGYLTTRDGTQLAIDVRPPLTPGTAPPYPTVIEYSGYGYANPAGPEHGLARVAQLMGFAVVDVNMRGTGCSGGAFNPASPLQGLDGYDVIETIARQPWVLDAKVGMIGISWGADTELFVGATAPPDLEAISPLSVTASAGTSTYDGGILNSQAARGALGREQVAQPAGPHTGEQWAYQRIQQGDQTCKANQVLHGEAVNPHLSANAFYSPSLDDPLDPVTFVDRITVPTFMACQWEDELDGGYCPVLVQHFTGTSLKWFTFTNGTHVDSLDPYTFDRWYDFLELFVAGRAPSVDAAAVQAVAPTVYRTVMGVKDSETLPTDPIQQAPTYSDALTSFEALPEVRVLLDIGAGPSPTGTVTPGDLYPASEQSFSSLPVPGTVADSWYLGPDGSLTDAPSSTAGVDSYTSNPKALPPTDYSGNLFTGGLWSNASAWDWNWQQYPAGSAVSYLTAPLESDTAVIGAGAVHLWVESSTPDVDFQATISEVSPDGNETFVQNGWLRAEDRALSTTTHNQLQQPSTVLEPVLSLRASDARSMPSGQFVEVVIPLYFEGHIYRAGSRIRLTIAAPGGTQPDWAFNQTQPSSGTAAEQIAFSPSTPSSLVLPVVPGVSAQTGLPACGSLRNEPCRPYAPFVNNGS